MNILLLLYYLLIIIYYFEYFYINILKYEINNIKLESNINK